ncbi:hypothetical protein B0G57_10597 [Trinickia symbiotica]|uniref:Alpha/beta hydrolase n=1 Tax=Trinickia symbiotica TaxID=863227 RepID=A0A2N7X172_9BURK|nr:hypothetical protein [Trinickia symbiotica]PMS35377.1 hypothetical protein C0Z20_17925 [Trinickia symbiotica]PPK45391.1 hypothetical protein B0G57_10597 [Trinickia symbiotica]
MSSPVAEAAPVQKQAVRRVPLQFDENGDPIFNSVTSPECFKVHALGVMPPKHVIPVIFVPGIMGTNLRANREAEHPGAPAWVPPNGAVAGLGEFGRRVRQSPRARQTQMSPDLVEVDDRGKVSLPRGLFTLTEEEAKVRGWGEVHFDSYGRILTALELALNDQYVDAGMGGSEMPVWTVAKTLKDKDGKDVLREWKPIKGAVPPLNDAEFRRLADYYFPVWACGYNWLGSNEDSSDLLIDRINKAIDWYKRGKYWIPVEKAIVVTHSMGGLVARRAAQKAGDRILGVVHGVQPVGGAPVVYRRFRAGTETGGVFDIMGSIVAAIIGWDAADITCVMANSPGPLELLPTKHYPAGWLKFEQEENGQTMPLMPPLPVADPYSEIYNKRVQDVWWGMIDETLIDPAALVKKKNKTAMESYGEAITAACDFHDKLQLYCHPNTYAYYGSDGRQVAFSNVRWVTRNAVPPGAERALPALTADSFTKLGEATLKVLSHKVSFSLANRDAPTSDSDPSSGDGTVPGPSGALVADGPGTQNVFRMKGFDHQHSYDSDIVQENVLYCIARIVQDAPRVEELPACKEYQ